jgi:uncharacterized membrane protein YkvA (DUF1232 family)
LRPLAATRYDTPDGEEARMPTVSLAKDMEVFLKSHGELAQIVLELLTSPALTLDAKRPLLGAAGYALEELDLIPDGVPLYGEMDDLFIKAIALDALLATPDGAALAGRALSDGETLAARLQRMKDRFFGFWSYCKKAADGLTARVAAQASGDAIALQQLIAEYSAEVEETRRQSAEPIELRDRDVESFVAQFRRLVPEEA